MSFNDFEKRSDVEKSMKKRQINNLKKWVQRGLVFIFIIMVVSFVFKGFYRVPEGYHATVERFEAYSKTVTSPGIKFKIPYIEEVFMKNMQEVHAMEYGYRTIEKGTKKSDPVTQQEDSEALIVSSAQKDNSSIVVYKLMVRWRIADLYKFRYNVDDIEDTTRKVLEDTVRNVIQSVSTETVLVNKNVIDLQIKPALQKKLNEYQAGIKILEVKTQNSSLPEIVSKTYIEKESAQQKKERFINKAIQYENERLPEARAHAKELTEEAHGYAAEVISEAKGNVSQFVELYEKFKFNEEVFVKRYYLDSIDNLVNKNEIIIDLNGNGVYKFYNMEGKNMNAIKNKVTQ